VSFPYLDVPEVEKLRTELAPYVDRYGDYTGYQMQYIIEDENGEVQLYMAFYWMKTASYLMFSFLNDEWFVVESNICK